jgi:hypothetical protein
MRNASLTPTLSALVAASLLAGCSRPAAPAEPDPAPQPAPAAAPAQPADLPAVTDVAEGEPRWMLHQDGENRFLAFAVPETDDVRFSLDCGPNERTVRLWRETGPDDTHDFRLTSGSSSFTFPAEYDPDGMAPQLHGVAPARAPVFVSFRETGQLTLTAWNQTQDLSASPMARPLVDSFFDYCGPPAPSE